MIELRNDQLTFRFPDVHEEASCSIDFQRTLRIPDDNRDYPLPPGLGRFPLDHVDDYADTLPDLWRQHGGVFLPMYQSEAMWLNFAGSYPCAIKIAAGKVNAVTGEDWTNNLSAAPQDYVVVPGQPWLDGFNVADGLIRQFVAMPLGAGYSAEEQLTGKAEHGGLQIVAYPMKREIYEERFRQEDAVVLAGFPMMAEAVACAAEPDMGLAPGGLMRQEIYTDDYGLDAWDRDHGSRCFVHLANSDMYAAITGRMPPHDPPTARDYTDAGLPWFEYYSDRDALPSAKRLSGLKSLGAKAIEKGEGPLPGNDPVEPKIVKTLGKRTVREGSF